MVRRSLRKMKPYLILRSISYYLVLKTYNTETAFFHKTKDNVHLRICLFEKCFKFLILVNLVHGNRQNPDFFRFPLVLPFFSPYFVLCLCSYICIAPWLSSTFMHRQGLNVYSLEYMLLKVQWCKLCDNKYMIASTQISNTESFAFIAAVVFKVLSRKVLFINRRRQ